jgi:hypothetical protein
MKCLYLSAYLKNTFTKGDPLWMPFGNKRTKVVDNLISLRKKYPDFVINGEKQLSLMKGNWGGIGTTPVQCPSWQMWQVISNNT